MTSDMTNNDLLNAIRQQPYYFYFEQQLEMERQLGLDNDPDYMTPEYRFILAAVYQIEADK